MLDELKVGAQERLEPLVPENAHKRLKEILRSAERDFSGVRARRLSAWDLQQIVGEAFEKWEGVLRAHPPQDSESVQASWNGIVTDFFENNYWGYPKNAPSADYVARAAKPSESRQLFYFLRAVLLPLLITKSFLFYFGIQYSRYPGQGYGWGAFISGSFTVVMLIYFIWKQSKLPSDEE